MREHAFVSFVTLSNVEELAGSGMPIVAGGSLVTAVLLVVETDWSASFARRALPCLGWCSPLS